MFSRQKGFTLLVILILAYPAIATELKSYDIDMCSFNLHGCELNPPVERAIVRGISLIIKTYKETFGFQYPEDIKVKIIIFTDREEFVAYQKKRKAGGITQVGYYSTRYREVVLFWKTPSEKTKDAKKMVDIIFHETSHMMLMTYIRFVLAGYEDTNDAERLSVDPAMRHVVGERAKNKSRAC